MIAGLIRQVEAFVPGDAAVAAVLVDDTPYLAGAVSTSPSPSLYLIQPTSFERMAAPHGRSYSCRAYPLAYRRCQREVTTRWVNGFGEGYRISQWTFDADGSLSGSRRQGTPTMKGRQRSRGSSRMPWVSQALAMRRWAKTRIEVSIDLNLWATKGQQPPQNPNDPQRTRLPENRSRTHPNALKRPPGLDYGTASRYDRRGAIPKVVGRPLAVPGSGQRRRSWN